MEMLLLFGGCVVVVGAMVGWMRWSDNGGFRNNVTHNDSNHNKKQ